MIASQFSLKPRASPRTRVVRTLANASWLRPLNDIPAIDDLLAALNPLWSVAQVKARVEKIIDETADTKTFVLRPNRHWTGFAAGQHTVIDIDIDGRRYQRAYSLSSNSRDKRLLSITVKRQCGGRVSNALHERIKIGDLLGLSAAGGDFRLPDMLPAKIFLLGAGSGVTPILSMLHELKARAYGGDVVFLHCSRTARDAVLADTLRVLVKLFPALRWIEHHSEQSGRLDPAMLARHVPDCTARMTFLCGPPEFTEWVRHHWQAEGASDRLRFERFGAPRSALGDADASAEIRCSRSGRFTARGYRSLLEEAEVAGLKANHGCRVGICHSCSCRKIGGAVENLLTGEISTQPDELIRLCISAARSDLQLDL